MVGLTIKLLRTMAGKRPSGGQPELISPLPCQSCVCVCPSHRMPLPASRSQPKSVSCLTVGSRFCQSSVCLSVRPCGQPESTCLSRFWQSSLRPSVRPFVHPPTGCQSGRRSARGSSTGCPPGFAATLSSPTPAPVIVVATSSGITKRNNTPFGLASLRLSYWVRITRASLLDSWCGRRPACFPATMDGLSDGEGAGEGRTRDSER
jgi:hypothetical protein